MRKLTGHEFSLADRQIYIDVLDEPGHRGTCHKYQISIPGSVLILEFQNGPIQEVGVNGISHESLLVILIDRLRRFQFEDSACRENALALTKLEEALMWLGKRTQDRIQRGVEGTSEE